MILPDHEIEKRLQNGLEITPYDPACLNPASYDVRLCGAYKWQRTDSSDYADTADLSQERYFSAVFSDKYRLCVMPGDFFLMSTQERFKIPTDLVAILSGKSSLGRIGLVIHATAGFIDPGFEGNITLEVSNVGRKPILLYPGMRIGQLSFTQLSSPCRTPYGGSGSHYQDQTGPQESRYNL